MTRSNEELSGTKTRRELALAIGVLGLGCLEAALAFALLGLGGCGSSSADDPKSTSVDTDASPDAMTVTATQVTEDGGVDAEVPPECLEIDCARGTCVVQGAEARCICDGNFTGEACVRCAVGYQGADCTECMGGFSMDEAGNCVSDPCSAIECEASETCIATPERTGCVPTACLKEDCSGHGQCLVKENAFCSCDEGYTGDSCESCEEGLMLDDNGNCVPAICTGVDCGPGTCFNDGGAAACECPDNFSDAMCTACEGGYTLSRGACVLTLPPITSATLKAWHDAAQPASIRFGAPAKVELWRDVTTGGFPALWFEYESHEADYILFDQAIRFDGTNHRAASYSDHLGMGNYVLYMVLKWDQEEAQWLWQTHGQEDNDAFADKHGFSLQILANGNVRAEHRGDFSSTPGDIVEADFFTHGQKQLIKVARQPFLNSTAFYLSNGTQNVQVESTQTAFDEAAVGTIGWGHSNRPFFDGDMHEVIAIHGDLSQADADAIEAYLKAKWGL